MKRSSVKDLTVGSPFKLIMGFMIPLLCGLLFQQIYNMVDTFIVGRVMGVEALAGVGSTGSINFLIIGACVGLCSGFAIPVARKFGEGDYQGLKNYVGNIVWLSTLFSILLTLICTIGCNYILKLMGTPTETFLYAYDYIFVIFLGIPVTIAYNSLAGLMRSVGDSKTPVIILMSSSIINIVLDIVFVAVLGFGVAGAAWATVISQCFSAVTCFIVITKKFDILHPKKENMRPRGKYISNLCMMGLPMAIQYSITGIGSVVLQSAVNGLGALYMATVASSSKIASFLIAPFEALGNTMATYASQNVGAGKYDRIRKGLRVALIIGSMYAILAFICLSIFGGKLAAIFTDDPSLGIEPLAKKYLTINSAGYILLLLVNSTRFLIQGIGYAKVAILAGVMEMFARILSGVILIPIIGFTGSCLANPLAWLFADVLLIPMYFICMRRLEHKRQL